MDGDSTHIFFYSVGTILGGYLMTLPFWGVGALWNRMQPKWAFNPWILPLVAMLGVYFCFAIVVFHLHEGDLNTAIVVLGMLPPTIGCAVAARRYQRAKKDKDQVEL